MGVRSDAVGSIYWPLMRVEGGVGQRNIKRHAFDELASCQHITALQVFEPVLIETTEVLRAMMRPLPAPTIFTPFATLLTHVWMLGWSSEADQVGLAPVQAAQAGAATSSSRAGRAAG